MSLSGLIVPCGRVDLSSFPLGLSGPVNPAVQAQQHTESHYDDSNADDDQTMIPAGVDRNIWPWRSDLLQGTFPARWRGTTMPGSKMKMPGVDSLYSSPTQPKASIELVW